jgi:hypothetical protein
MSYPADGVQETSRTGLFTHRPPGSGDAAGAVLLVTPPLPSPPSAHAGTDRGRESVTVSLQPTGHAHKSSADPLYGWVRDP